jgi:hypothetical protein
MAEPERELEQPLLQSGIYYNKDIITNDEFDSFIDHLQNCETDYVQNKLTSLSIFYSESLDGVDYMSNEIKKEMYLWSLALRMLDLDDNLIELRNNFMTVKFEMDNNDIKMVIPWYKEYGKNNVEEGMQFMIMESKKLLEKLGEVTGTMIGTIGVIIGLLIQRPAYPLFIMCGVVTISNLFLISVSSTRLVASKRKCRIIAMIWYYISQLLVGIYISLVVDNKID